MSILSSAYFDPIAEVDTSRPITFGPTGIEATATRYASEGEDANLDGYDRDLTCKFRNADLGLSVGDERVYASSVRPADQYDDAKLCRLVSVSGWVSPRISTRWASTCSLSAMASSVRPAACVVRQLDRTSFGGLRQLDGTRAAPVRWDHL